MNIDIEKQNILCNLYKLEQECQLLLERIPVYREGILKVKTEEEALQFEETHDLEDGLDIIQLF